MTGEIVDVVDESDRVLYQAPVDECKKRGLLHRSVATILRNSKADLLLQRRSLRDDWLPGKWTVSSTGHLKAGEVPSEGAIRELSEELGVASEITFLFKEILPRIKWKNLAEYEIAYLFETSSDLEFRADPEEVAEVRFFSPKECLSLTSAKGNMLTPDAVFLMQRYLLERQ